jgi:reticulocyte-binding protein
LHRALANEELLRQLQLEDSTTKGIKDLKGNLEEALKREEEERLQKEAALAKEKEALAKEKEERRQKDEALAKEKEKSIKFAEKMLKYGETIEEIMQETGLTREEIEEIKKKLA